MSVCKIVSGALCALLEKHNFDKLDDHYRIPIYVITGSSLGFMLCYGVVDIAEVCKRMWRGFFVGDRSLKNYSPLIMTNLLYLIMMSLGIVMGGGLGIVYGVTDIEGLFTNESMKLVYWETLEEILSLAPIGLILGLAFGMFVGAIRALELHFKGDEATRSGKNSETGSDDDEERIAATQTARKEPSCLNFDEDEDSD